MKKKEILQKEIVSKLGIDFNEASELFSDETLNKMQMAYMTGASSSSRGIVDLLVCSCNIGICPDIDVNVCDSSCPTSEPSNWVGCISAPPRPNEFCAAQDNCIPITYPPSLF